MEQTSGALRRWRRRSLLIPSVRPPAGANMATLRDRILELASAEPGLTDREIANRLLGRDAPQQAVNQVARQLASEGRIVRRERPDGKIGNYPAEGRGSLTVPPRSTSKAPPANFLSEDDAKRKLQVWLEAAGWKVAIVWSRGQGIDMDARRGNSRWVIEVKGQGTLNPMRVNYFLGVLGELLQRMEDPQARYSIALADVPQFWRLWNRFPSLAKQRTGISALFVAASGHVEEVA